jgi:hypothetical protein
MAGLEEWDVTQDADLPGWLRSEMRRIGLWTQGELDQFGQRLRRGIYDL